MFSKKNVLIVVRIPANTHKEEDCDVISDQWTALYEERPPQRDFSWGPSILKEKVMVNLRTIRRLIWGHLLMTVSDPWS